MSPELLDSSRTSSDGRPTRESDCYALGMVIYEVNKLHLSLRSLIDQSQVLTGLHPFYHLPGYSGLLVVARGGRPGKPVDARSLGFSDKLWDLVQLCWSELSSSRPTAQRLLDHLTDASPTWVPPPVYPTAGIADPSVTDTDTLSTGFFGIVPDERVVLFLFLFLCTGTILLVSPISLLRTGQ